MEMKARREEIVRLNTEKVQLERKVEREHRQALKYKQLLDESKTPLLMAQTEIAALQKEVDQFKRREETRAKELEVLERERNLQVKETQRAHEKVHEKETRVKEQERIAYSLENEMNSFKAETVKQRKAIYQLEKERERYGVETSEQRALYLQAMEEVKLRDMRVNELQKKVGDGETKLKQQQALYEAVRSDRNLYSKNLIESQDEIAEMKRKFKIMNHQIEQLKEEIQAKDQAYVKERIEHTRSDKEKETLKNELMRLKKVVATAETSMKNYQSEVDKLNHIISEADAERYQQQREYDVVINERDILGTQLIRRNDELALLYEKIKIQRSAISQGEVAYRERLEDLRVLRLRENGLRRELHIQNSQAAALDGLRAEVYTLQRELLQDRTKVKALSEELENPNNTHRWRKLEGSDPGTYEMLQKIQALLQRLIAKTEEVVEKDLLIQEKDKLYVELKNILARQPGPEVAEQLSIYQQGLRDKTKSMKAMASELNMYQAQVSESKYEMEKLTRELQEMKRKYYEQKRRETMHTERHRASQLA